MSGRFLAAPLLAAVAILIWGYGVSRPASTAAPRAFGTGKVFETAALLLLLILGVYGTLTPTPLGDDARRDGDIADERAYYTPHTGLLYPDRTPHPWALQGMELREGGAAVVEHGNVGFLGFYAGPDVHIVDRNGLTDPLLARLPVRDPADWRIGHFRREVPPGYVDTLREGRNLIHDADLAAFYEPLREATRGPLWSAGRLGAVWRLNWGVYDGLLPEVWPR